MGGVCSNNNNIFNNESNLARSDNIRKGDDGELYVIEKKFIENKTNTDNPDSEAKDGRFYRKIPIPNEIQEKTNMVRKKNSILFLSSNQKGVEYENGDVKVMIFK